MNPSDFRTDIERFEANSGIRALGLRRHFNKQKLSAGALGAGAKKRKREESKDQSNKKRKDNTCAICLESYDDSSKKQLRCGHTYHLDCICMWIQTSNTKNCPYCRADINYDLGCPPPPPPVYNPAIPQQHRGSNITSIVIREGTTTIGARAFANCRRLASVILPEGVTIIGDYAFQNCSSLTSVTLPSSLTTIGHFAFRWVESLTNVIIPAGVTTIGNDAFYKCSSLTSVDLSRCTQLTTIGRGTFQGCSSLTSVTLPEGVTTIGSGAFPSSCQVVRR